MACVGKLIAKKFMNKRIEMFVGLENEWLSYADGDVQAYTLIIATPIDYDEECGVIEFKTQDNSIFYVNEESIDMFWEAGKGFRLIEHTSSTIRTGKQWLQPKKRDIM